jgi:hypothetical protein
MPSIPAVGISQSTIQGRASSRVSFEKFLEEQHNVDESWPKTMEELTEDQANDKALYERYAYWLTYESESSRGGALSLDTITSYVRAAAQIMKQRFGKTGSNLDKLESTGSANWMSMIVRNIARLVVQQAFDEGVDLYSEPSPLHLHHVKAITVKLAEAGTQDAAFRRLVVLMSFIAAGRCGEVASVAWPLIRWDYALGIPIVKWRDIKNNKDKPVVLLPSRLSSDGDIFIGLGDCAVLGQFCLGGPSDFLFHQFAQLKGAGVAPKVSKMLQALVPGAPGDYSEYTVNELGLLAHPPTSHDIRHGAVETMEANGVGPGHVIDVTGHAPGSRGGDKTGVQQGSAFASYHKATPARVTVGKCLEI